MRILLTGSGSQLGKTLLAKAPAGLTLIGLDRAQLDIAEPNQVRDAVLRDNPDVIVNTAAYTAVDLAETNAGEASRINETGPALLAQAALEAGARLIHISTDFVFDGRSNSPYRPDDVAEPNCTYGETKLAGEDRIREILPNYAVIIRTAWLYSQYGSNFVLSILRLLKKGEEIAVVDDQVGSPTWAGSLANAIFAFVTKPEIHGTYHWADSGSASWYEFAQAIQDEAIELGYLQKKTTIRPIPSSEYPMQATRPAYSVLDCSETQTLLGIKAQPWRHNLRLLLKELGGK